MGARRHVALAALCAVLFLTFLDNTIVSVTLADVQARLHAGVTALQWVVNGYALTFAALMLTAGALGDRFGRKRVMLTGVAIFCAGSVVAALAPGTGVLIAGRVVMGVGAAASEPGTLSMVRHVYPDARARARAIGVWAAVSGLALALGPVIGGVLVGLMSFRLVFWFNLAFGASALAVAQAVLPESSDRSDRRVDVAGSVTGALALGTVTFAIIAGETSGYATGWVVALFVAASLCACAFVVVERRAEQPVLDLALFRNPTFAGANVVAFVAYFGTFAIFFFVALYLVLLANTSPYGIALDFVPMSVGMVLASLWTGRWVARAGARQPMVLGCVLAGTGILLTNAVLGPHAGFGDLAGPLALAGTGFGIAVVPVTTVVLRVVPARRSGMAASATNTSRELGAVFGVAVLGTIVNGQLAGNIGRELRSEGLGSIVKLVVNALTSGSAPNVPGPRTNPAVRSVVSKATAAAQHAFGHGLDIALTLSGSLLLLGAVVALLTLRGRHDDPPWDGTPDDAAPVLGGR